MKRHLLIVEDDSALNQLLSMIFEEQGYAVASAYSKAEALEKLALSVPDLALVDQQLPDGIGLDLLVQLKEREPDLVAIMITGVHDLDVAIRAIKKGAYDFIYKPIKTEELLHVVERALEHRRLVRKVKALKSEVEKPVTLGEMIGKSQAMVAVSKEIALVAGSDARVLITGESGTGKELVARAIHSHSHREGPFLAVNCAAIVDTLLESDLFGHEKGAFTGAVARKIGKFELASEGTLFLDEVGELALPLQAKLLRILQEGTFTRVGGTQQLTSQARVIAATNRELSNEVEAGHFRRDLFYRLNVISIHIPPLRERHEDIPLLVHGLMERLAENLHRSPLQITPAAMNTLVVYDWPGNVRELENILTQALLRARDTVLTPDLLNLQPPAEADIAKTEERHAGFRSQDGSLLNLDELEAQHIQRTLEETFGHKGKTCEILGISRPALERKIHKYGLQLPRMY
jgi:two-component system response regulator AtoC